MLRLTSKLLSDIDDPQSPVDASASPLGDWYGHIFIVERKKCIVFINEPTMFVSLACGVVKADYRKIVSFFLEHLQAALRNEAFDQKQIDFILGLHTNVGIGKTKNRSAVGALNDRIDDTRTILAVNGGFANCKCGEINTALNETPMKPVHFSNGLAEMAAFLEREMK